MRQVVGGGRKKKSLRLREVVEEILINLLHFLIQHMQKCPNLNVCFILSCDTASKCLMRFKDALSAEWAKCAVFFGHELDFLSWSISLMVYCQYLFYCQHDALQGTDIPSMVYFCLAPRVPCNPDQDRGYWTWMNKRRNLYMLCLQILIFVLKSCPVCSVR